MDKTEDSLTNNSSATCEKPANFLELLPPELLYTNVFPYLKTPDLKNLRLLSRAINARANQYISSSKALFLCIETKVQLDRVISLTLGRDLPYALILDKKMLKVISSIMKSNEGEQKQEKALLAKVIYIKIEYTSMTNNDMFAINKIVQCGNTHTLYLRGTQVTDVSALGQVHTLDLCEAPVTDVSALGQVHTLDLSYCHNLMDVSSLGGGVHMLNLSYTKVTDVSALGNVHMLDLSHCRNLTDVSSLGGIHTLDLSHCRNLTDVSSLGGIHTLDLSHCRNLTDVSSLGGVHTLNLRYTKVTDVSALKNVHTLDLSHCRNLTDVSLLGSVHMLNLSHCCNLTRVLLEGNFDTLDLIHCYNLTDVRLPGSVHTLNLSDTKVTDVSALGNVHTLDLSCSSEVTDVSALRNVHTLDLSYCRNLTDVSSLGAVHTLSLSGTLVTDVSALRNVHRLDLSSCYHLKELKRQLFISRQFFKYPSRASAIPRSSLLHLRLLRGNLATVRPLEDYAAVSAETKRMLGDEIKAVVEKTLKHYNTLWKTSNEDETARSSYITLAEWRIGGSLEDIVKSVIQFFITAPGHWHAGKRQNNSRLNDTEIYQKGKGPSIKTLLMRYLLTMEFFSREVIGHKLRLTTGELAHGLEYELDLSKDYFGGCDIDGLLCFFENECKRVGGLGKPGKRPAVFEERLALSSYGNIVCLRHSY